MKTFPVLNAAVILAMLAFPEIVSAQVPQTPAPVEESTQTVTLDFKDADINTVLRVMSLKSGVNIVAGPEVQGTVSIRLEDVPWRKALDVVLRTYGYVYEKDGNIIRVTTRDNLAAEPVVTKTFILNYSKAVEIQSAVQDMLTERGRIKVAERMNMLVVTDIPTNLFTIEEVIQRLDSVTPQAYIDSKVVRTDVTNIENLGIAWNIQGGLTGSSRPTTFPFIANDQEGGLGSSLRQFFPLTVNSSTPTINPGNSRAFPNNPVEATTGSPFEFGTLDFTNFSSLLQFLETKSNTKIVSNPRVVVLNNQTAKVQVGSDIPLPTFERNETTGSVEISGFSYREVGVVLNVTPHINAQQEILVDLQPEVSSQGDTVDFGDFQIPSFEVTKAVTQVLIRSGETIAIGGLMTDNASTAEQKVPYLSDVPVIGKLFRSKRQDANANSKVETLFFVTVTMVDTEGQPARAKKDDEDNMTAKTVIPPVNASAAPVQATVVQDQSSQQAAPAPGVVEAENAA